jgi:hypothetical protein
MSDPMDAHAVQAYALFQAYQRAGFKRGEALELVGYGIAGNIGAEELLKRGAELRGTTMSEGCGQSCIDNRMICDRCHGCIIHQGPCIQRVQHRLRKGPQT